MLPDGDKGHVTLPRCVPPASYRALSQDPGTRPCPSAAGAFTPLACRISAERRFRHNSRIALSAARTILGKLSPQTYVLQTQTYTTRLRRLRPAPNHGRPTPAVSFAGDRVGQARSHRRGRCAHGVGGCPEIEVHVAQARSAGPLSPTFGQRGAPTRDVGRPPRGAWDFREFSP